MDKSLIIKLVRKETHQSLLQLVRQSLLPPVEVVLQQAVSQLLQQEVLLQTTLLVI